MRDVKIKSDTIGNSIVGENVVVNGQTQTTAIRNQQVFEQLADALKRLTTQLQQLQDPLSLQKLQNALAHLEQTIRQLSTAQNEPNRQQAVEQALREIERTFRN